jgi:large subunit ribosomal protein L6
MSRIGRLPIDIPAGVKVEVLDDNTITVSGPLGTLNQKVNSKITVKLENNQVIVSRSSDDKEERAMHGLYRALIHNMVVGVSTGYKKTLVIAGIGYRATVQGNKLVLNLGYSHPIEVVEPEGIKFKTLDANTIEVSGISKELVGEVAAKIRGLRPVEPYHLYGIHYSDEKLVKKEGKKAASSKK